MKREHRRARKPISQNSSVGVNRRRAEERVPCTPEYRLHGRHGRPSGMTVDARRRVAPGVALWAGGFEWPDGLQAASKVERPTAATTTRNRVQRDTIVSAMVPAGYMAKRVVTRPDWLGAASVSSIYSVSGCIAENFADYINFWKHNGYWLFDSPEIITAIARENNIDLAATVLFFYEVYQLQFHCG